MAKQCTYNVLIDSVLVCECMSEKDKHKEGKGKRYTGCREGMGKGYGLYRVSLGTTGESDQCLIS